MQAESFLKSIGTATIWNGLNRLASLGKHIIVAAVIGLSTQLDIFYMAMALLGVFVLSWAKVLDVVTVPSLVSAYREKNLTDFKAISSGVFILTLLGSLLIAIMLYLLRDVLVYIAIGFNAQTKQLLAMAILWLMPAILLCIPLHFLGSILRALRQFSPYYQAEFITALFILLCLIVFKNQHYVLLWSFSIGTACAFLYLFSRTWRWIFPLTNPLTTTVLVSLKLAPSLLILQGAQYFYIFTDQIFASRLSEGAISALAYAVILSSLLPNLLSIPNSFITIIAEYRTPKSRSKKLNNVISMIIFLSVGITCFMIIASQAAVNILLERGVFTAQDTHRIATAISTYAWAIFPLFLIGPLNQIFQVEKKIGLIINRHLLGLVINLMLNALFLFGLGWGLHGIILATSISYWIVLITSLHALEKLNYQVCWKKHLTWGFWLLSIQSIAYGYVILLPPEMRNGLLMLITSTMLIAGLLLFAGILYPGKEKILVWDTIRRLSRLSK